MSLLSIRSLEEMDLVAQYILREFGSLLFNQVNPGAYIVPIGKHKV